MARFPTRRLPVVVALLAIGVIVQLGLRVTLHADFPVSFTLKERFGVSHPRQPVEFTFADGPIDPASARMIGPAGLEVPYQQLANGSILVQTRLPNSLLSQSWYFWRYPAWDPRRNSPWTCPSPRRRSSTARRHGSMPCSFRRR